MNKKIYSIILCIILITNIVLFKNVYAEDKKDVIRVGAFYLEPYIYINSNNEIDGYYVELLDLIEEKMNVEFEYILTDLKDFISNIDKGKVDIILGATITEENAEKFTYNKNSIGLEEFALYTNKNIDTINFENLNGLRFGYMEESTKPDFILNLFKSLDIKVIPILVDTRLELMDLMDNNKIDLMIDSAYSFNNYKKIYEFVGKQVYIAAKNENKDLIYKIDQIIVDYYNEDENLIQNLYDSYFNKEENDIDKSIMILVLSIILIFITFFAIYIIPKLIKLLKRRKIKNNLKNDRYLLYYQSISDPIKGIIVGFEGLLRLKDKNNKIISPAKFIPEIEKNNMMFDITLWIIKRVILDYNEIKNYNCIKNDNFYISLNLSIDEIQDNDFVDKAIELLKEANLEEKSICLEIVERVGIKELNKIIKNIYRLKEAGFKIAIDDFGTEYSNLDVLENLDADIIKVDKNYVDGLGKDLIKDETILFILRVAEKSEKIVVLEGIEDKEQDNIIKKFNSKNIFVQGYFYNKPMEIKKIKAL